MLLKFMSRSGLFYGLGRQLFWSCLSTILIEHLIILTSVLRLIMGSLGFLGPDFQKNFGTNLHNSQVERGESKSFNLLQGLYSLQLKQRVRTIISRAA